MKKRIVILTLVAAAIATALYAAPRHMRGHGGMAHFAFMRHLAELHEELDLTEAQTTQIHAIMRETREQTAQHRKEMHGNIKGVAQMLIANPNDVASAQAVLDRQDATERALKANMLTAASKALNVLTPEQRGKLAQILAERTSRWENRRN